MPIRRIGASKTRSEVAILVWSRPDDGLELPDWMHTKGTVVALRSIAKDELKARGGSRESDEDSNKSFEALRFVSSIDRPYEITAWRSGEAFVRRLLPGRKIG